MRTLICNICNKDAGSPYWSFGDVVKIKLRFLNWLLRIFYQDCSIMWKMRIKDEVRTQHDQAVVAHNEPLKS